MIIFGIICAIFGTLRIVKSFTFPEEEIINRLKESPIEINPMFVRFISAFMGLVIALCGLFVFLNA